MIKTIYICDHCGKEYDYKDITRVNLKQCLCSNCAIKWHFLCENQNRIREEFFNAKGLPSICDPFNGDIILPSQLKLLTEQETREQVYLNLYQICGTEGLSATDILDIAKSEGVKIE